MTPARRFRVLIPASAAVLAGLAGGATAYSRVSPVPAHVAVLPWLDRSVTGTIAPRPRQAAEPKAPPPAAGRAGAGEGGTPTRWTDPPARPFNYRLRGSI